jgi:hypothetical protein
MAATRNAPAGRVITARDAGAELRIGLGVAALVYFGLSLLYFLPAFLPGRHIFGTDYLAGGYFFYDFVSQRLAAGEMPKWVPYLYGGLPLSANPGSTFYPVRLIADFLLPVVWILPFIFLVQFGAAGLGMYLLARELRCRSWIAFLAGLAFQFTGITLSAVFAGHDGRVIVATFAPLLFYFLHRGIRTGGLGAFAGAAATIGFGLLSFQIQSNYYLLIAGAVWAVFCLVHLNLAKQPRVLATRVALGLAAVAFGFSLAAVNFLPFIDYVPESPRGAEGGRGYEYSTSWSMSPVELLAVAVPEHAGVLEHYVGDNPFKLHTEYTGALVLILFVLGFRYARADRYWLFFAGLAVFTLTIAFGGHTPIYRLYYEILPGTSRFRAPSISFFLFSLSLVAMATITLERLAVARESSSVGARNRQKGETAAANSPGLWLAAFVAVAVLAMALAAASADGSPRDGAMATGFFRFALFSGLTSGAIWLWWTERLRTLGFVALVAVLTVADLWVVNRRFFDTVPPPAVTFAPDDVVRFLQAQPQPERVWVLPFGQPYRDHGNYLMLFGIEQAGGEHGNQLQRFNEFAGAGQDVYVDWSNFLESVNFLRAANVRHIVSMVELEAPFMREVHRGSAIVYENTLALPRAYLASNVVEAPMGQPTLDLIGSPEFDVAGTAVVEPGTGLSFPAEPLDGVAQVVEHTPDRVVVRATTNRPALLVLSDNYFEGWRATVNGTEVPILRTNHTFRGVPVGAGSSDVVFEYLPADLYTGFYIYLLGLLLLTGYGTWLLVARVRRPERSA